MTSKPTNIITSSPPTTAVSSTAANRAGRLAVRIGIASTLAISGVIHAYLYIHGYQYIPTIGTAFLVQASVFCALGVLVAAGGPAWLRWAGGVSSVAALIAFALSRTVGLSGFTEHGWNPAPQAALSVAAEALTVVLVAFTVLSRRRRTPIT
jgi:hypothetical protein